MAKQVKTVRNNARRGTDGKRGFTLVELVIVIALLAILTAMTVSFSVLVSGYAKDSRAVTDYTEDCATAKEAVIAYVRARDVSGTVFTLTDGSLTASDGTGITFSDGVLTLGDKTVTGLDTVKGITADQSGKLIRITLQPTDESEREDFVFVLALRSATVEVG
ncbi:MAG: type II secretion system protein [Clostridia bacterium]|nr:type II secretion system protein [Clostridia bacterium]